MTGPKSVSAGKIFSGVFDTRAVLVHPDSQRTGRPVRVATDFPDKYRGLSFPGDTYYPWRSPRGPCALSPSKHPHEKTAHPHMHT